MEKLSKFKKGLISIFIFIMIITFIYNYIDVMYPENPNNLTVNELLGVHKLQVFRWQFFSGQVIFIVVNFITFMGLYMSWLQFKKDIVINKQKNEEQTTLKISSKNIEISSHVIGLIILIISLAFYLMYLKFVFPIVEV